MISKAFLKYKKTAPVNRPLSRLSYNNSQISVKHVEVECLLLKPDCRLDINFSLWRYPVNWDWTALSNTLETVDKREIGRKLLSSWLVFVLGIGTMLAILKSFGIRPDCIDWLKIRTIGMATNWALSFNNLRWRSSSPTDFEQSRIYIFFFYKFGGYLFENETWLYFT